MLEQKNPKLENLLLSEIIPIDVLEELKENDMVVYNFYSKVYDSTVNLALALQKKQVFTKTILILYVVDDPEIVENIKQLIGLTKNKRVKKITKIYELIKSGSIEKKSENYQKINNKQENDLRRLESINYKQIQESSSSVILKELPLVTKLKKSFGIIKIVLFFTVKAT